MGGPTRAPLLVVEEYDHWKVRMEGFLLAEDKGEKIWRSVKEGPHIPVRTVVKEMLLLSLWVKMKLVQLL